MKITKLFFLIALLAVGLYSCTHKVNNNTDLSETGNYSQTGSSKSRRMNGDCLSCHGKGGGETVFTLGGTVYKSNLTTKNPNIYVKLYSAPNGGGQLMKTIEVDAEGNFYSTASYNFYLPLYPVVEGNGGAKRYMGTALTQGSCGSCHGVSTDPINID